MIKMIVAVDKQCGIAKDGRIPWDVPEDMKLFRKLTTGDGNNAVVMGRNTSRTLPSGFLRDRMNFILSTTTTGQGPDWQYVNKYEKIDIEQFDDVWIIGGAQLYSYMLSTGFVDEVHVSIIPEDYECDLLFNMEDVTKKFNLDRMETLEGFAHLVYTPKFI